MPHHIVVTCSNCGAGTDLVGLAGLIVAVVAAVFAGIVVCWTRSEHVEFLRRLRARARFKLTLRATLSQGGESPAPGVDDPLAVAAQVGHSFPQVFEIGITNIGDSAAGPTVVNVVVPQWARPFFWCDSAGNKWVESPAPVTTADPLKTESGASVPAHWISRDVHRVSTRTPVLLHFSFQVGNNVNRVPIRVTASCDELPDEEEEKILDGELKVHDLTPPYPLRGHGGP
jgi:hypothetical protein